MKFLTLLLSFSAFCSFPLLAGSKVCYGNDETNCFATNAECAELQITCSTNPNDDPWTNGCLCTPFISWSNPDENDVNWHFRVFSTSSLQILNADDTWTTFYDFGIFADDEFITAHFIDELDRIVITVYEETDLNDYFENGGTLSSIVSYTVNVAYDNEAYQAE